MVEIKEKSILILYFKENKIGISKKQMPYMENRQV